MMININFLLIPEIVLILGIIAILLISVFINKNSFKFSLYSSLILLIITSFLVLLNYQDSFINNNKLFITNLFIINFKILIIISSILVLLIMENYFQDLKINKFEIPILILFSVFGMLVMISSNNLMSMYLGIEIQSLSLYILASINRKSLKSSEAGLKYFILGALSSAFLLYGCSLIYGFTGSLNFEDIYQKMSVFNNLNIGLIFGLIFVITSLGFKISAVPFHMWAPDVYEGSPTPITAFFTTAPKIAGIALLIRFLFEPFGNFWFDWHQIIIFISIASMILGAFAAIVQDNFKRLLAYSSIGHIGYILIGVVSANDSGIKAIFIYLVIYIFMNFGIFAILLSLKNDNGYIEKISNLSGLGKSNPIVSIVLTIMLFSMAGIPPLAGFFGKFYIFIAAIESKFFVLAIIGVLSSVIAAFYYLRIIKVIYFEENKENLEITLNPNTKFVIYLSALFIILFILFQSKILELSNFVSYNIIN
tara:strand:- start:357 stop:1796 length:1440 start_codon:yes stop_codon:yes gene_type:complete